MQQLASRAMHALKKSGFLCCSVSNSEALCNSQAS
jgi:hypothetical protein